MSLLPENLSHTWRQRAEQLRDWGVSAEVAGMWERAATELEQALAANGSEVLTLPEAARLTGMTPGYLGDMIRAGKLPNAGRKHAPRIRRADLPTRINEPALPQPQCVSRTKVTDMTTRILRQR